jgi:hypothetical protein
MKISILRRKLDLNQSSSKKNGNSAQKWLNSNKNGSKIDLFSTKNSIFYHHQRFETSTIELIEHFELKKKQNDSELIESYFQTRLPQISLDQVSASLVNS